MRDGRDIGKGSSTYRTCVFFLSPDGNIEAIPQRRYVAVVRREAPMPQLARQRVRLADWYIEVRDGEIVRIDNETYDFLEFDAQGFACPPCDRHPEQSKFWQPTEAERESMRALLDAAG